MYSTCVTEGVPEINYDSCLILKVRFCLCQHADALCGVSAYICILCVYPYGNVFVGLCWYACVCHGSLMWQPAVCTHLCVMNAYEGKQMVC